MLKLYHRQIVQTQFHYYSINALSNSDIIYVRVFSSLLFIWWCWWIYWEKCTSNTSRYRIIFVQTSNVQISIDKKECLDRMQLLNETYNIIIVSKKVVDRMHSNLPIKFLFGMFISKTFIVLPNFRNLYSLDMLQF